jgi:hypothetical protein
MPKREIVIFKKDNKVIYVDNVVNYIIYSKIDTLVVNTENREYKFNINEIMQVDINSILDKVVLNSDFILLP